MSVVVPSYRRPELLRRCLTGLASQSLPAHEVIVVRRDGDEATAAVLDQSPVTVQPVTVYRGGIVAALRAGAAAARGDVLVFTDDDAVPRADWLAALRRHYADPSVGGVGGRDLVPSATEQLVPSSRVGRIGRWGQLSGHHHIGAGPVTDVDVLKGVNMSFRRTALALPDGLLGDGAQVHNEVAICTWATDQGWRLIYDPSIVVDHYTGPRFDKDGRQRRAKGAVYDEAYNLTVALLSLRSDLRLRRLLFGMLVGDRATPGLLRISVALLRREWSVVALAVPSLSGQAAAALGVARGRRLHMQPLPASPEDV
jgi:cellulose synthase/poly-beta-1,6-N-acetylglucosamine synthase-like glycosyltransferase